MYLTRSTPRLKRESTAVQCFSPCGGSAYRSLRTDEICLQTSTNHHGGRGCCVFRVPWQPMIFHYMTVYTELTTYAQYVVHQARDHIRAGEMEDGVYAILRLGDTS